MRLVILFTLKNKTVNVMKLFTKHINMYFFLFKKNALSVSLNYLFLSGEIPKCPRISNVSTNEDIG